MWKIQTLSASNSTVIFSLSGRLRAANVEELQALLQGESRKITFDLREVDIVDREVVVFLSRCTAGGVSLEKCPQYIEQWIAKERASQSETNSKELME
jgi:hypothetical protein